MATTETSGRPGEPYGDRGDRYDFDRERERGRRDRFDDDDDDRRRGYGDRNRRERGIFISTESRPGFVTTEFWLALLGIAALIILAFAVDEVGDRWGLTLATAVLVAYVISRGIAKAGSSDVKRRSLDKL
jgi:hypothetical protein